MSTPHIVGNHLLVKYSADAGIDNIHLVKDNASPAMPLLQTGGYEARRLERIRKQKPTSPVIQPGHELSDGLICALPMSEGSGTTLTDISGNGNDATLVNTPTWGSGTLGPELSFDSASTERGTLPVDLDDGSGAFSVSTWFKTANAVNAQTLAGRYVSGTDIRWFLALYADGSVHFRCCDSNLNVTYAATSLIAVRDDSWHMATGIFDPATGSCSIYVDGAFGSATTGLTGATLNTACVQVPDVGAFGGANWLFDGELGDIRMWNKALTAAEVKRLYSDPWSQYAPPLPVDTRHPFVRSPLAALPDYEINVVLMQIMSVTNLASLKQVTVVPETAWVSIGTADPIAAPGARFASMENATGLFFGTGNVHSLVSSTPTEAVIQLSHNLAADPPAIGDWLQITTRVTTAGAFPAKARTVDEVGI